MAGFTNISIAPQPVETGGVHLGAAGGILNLGVGEIGCEAQRFALVLTSSKPVASRSKYGCISS